MLCVFVCAYDVRGVRKRHGYHGSIVDSHCLDAPGNAESNQNIKHITANRVGDSHVP